MRISDIIKASLLVIFGVIEIKRSNMLLEFMQHREVRRSWFDRLFGRNKRYDDIAKVRGHIREINKKYILSKRNPFIRPYGADIDFRKFSEITNRAILDEPQYILNFGADVLYKRYVDVRDELVEMLKDAIDLSAILSEIRDEKIRSLGI